jgi:adenylate kinase family enzyme
VNTVIIGNSGSGKTWLAARLAACTGARVVHLDDVAYLPGGYTEKRSPQEVQQIVATSKRHERWIVEGIHTDLAELYLDEADCLVWLDMDLATCESRFGNRTAECPKDQDRSTLNISDDTRHEFVRGYHKRSGPWSWSAHAVLFREFARRKQRLTSEEAVMAFMKETQESHAEPTSGPA